jgi:hypothetical protein
LAIVLVIKLIVGVGVLNGFTLLALLIAVLDGRHHLKSVKIKIRIGRAFRFVVHFKRSMRRCKCYRVTTLRAIPSP